MLQSTAAEKLSKSTQMTATKQYRLGAVLVHMYVYTTAFNTIDEFGESLHCVNFVQKVYTYFLWKTILIKISSYKFKDFKKIKK